MSIPTSCLPREINLGDRRVRVDPPTVRQAVEIMHALDNLDGAEDIRVLMQLIGDLQWCGAIDIMIHLRNQLISDPAAFSRLIKDIILQGYDPEKQTEKTKDQESKNTGGVDWRRLLSQYCSAYQGKDPYDVWNETPFAFFMEMLPEARKEEARQHINSAFEASFAMGGSEEMMGRWQKQAGWETEKEQKESAYQEELSEEELKEQREAFKNELHG